MDFHKGYIHGEPLTDDRAMCGPKECVPCAWNCWATGDAIGFPL